ncbi:hypothetical protein KX928_23235 [Roseobacter sp. YSTF-M11]|uniref:Uncharacterized protein n=1 Tax=Roseobacter insulae TaxID=2859783 RepID=A0A9X1K2X0_9RHOB|nr:hypothetical protein [Roseobacter insulae]MBW4710714.1 hypothetical protein [Roseobacter insulae]
MAEKWDPVTAADQTLIFTLQIFVFEIHKRPEDMKMHAAILRDVLPHVTQDHPIIEPMIAPARMYVENIEADCWSGGEYYDAKRALTDFARWRAARSWEVFQAQQPQPAEKEVQSAST